MRRQLGRETMERVIALINEGNYEAAFDRLTRLIEAEPSPEARAAHLLLLAELYSFYGPDGLGGLEEALLLAEETWPPIAETPLFQALATEMEAISGQTPEIFATSDPRACYHLAQVAAMRGEAGAALGCLSAAHELPPYLAWRALATRGRVLEEMEEHLRALAAYREAARLAPKNERFFLILDAAAVAVEAGQAEEGRALLLSVKDEAQSADALATWHYLLGRAELALENPNRALTAFVEAEKIEAEAGEPSYGLPLAKGQTLMQLGRYREAAEAFAAAHARAPEEERTYSLHELALAELEAGDFAKAETHLKEVFADSDYPHRGAAAADLAELYYRLGDLEAARIWAEDARALGHLAGAELILGHVAFERLRYEEALEHYRRAAEVAPEGSRDWLTAQQMAADTLAQLGFPDPAEALRRAEAALAHTPPSDEWSATLSAYAKRARELLSQGRTLN